MLNGVVYLPDGTVSFQTESLHHQPSLWESREASLGPLSLLTCTGLLCTVMLCALE